MWIPCPEKHTACQAPHFPLRRRKETTCLSHASLVEPPHLSSAPPSFHPFICVTFSSLHPSHPSASLSGLPPRLRAVLSRGLKRLDGLQVRPLAPPSLSESDAATASVTLKSVAREALSSLPPPSSLLPGTASHTAPGQLAQSPGKLLAAGGGSFGRQDLSGSGGGGSTAVSAGHTAIVATSGLLGASEGLATLKVP